MDYITFCRNLVTIGLPSKNCLSKTKKWCRDENNLLEHIIAVKEFFEKYIKSFRFHRWRRALH